MKRPALPIGTSDFLKLRRADKYYVDKSGFVTDVLRSSAEVLLLPRPRRFGKTLNISTLQAFVERTGDAERASRAALFEDLAVWRAGEDVQRHFGRYPVIFLTFKDVKTQTWATTRGAIVELIAEECRRLEPVLSPALTQGEQRVWQALHDGSADDPILWRALALLSEWLHRATGERAVILVSTPRG